MKWLGWCAVVLAGAVSAARAADSNTLVGIHFWGDRNDTAPRDMLDSVNRGGWDLEIVNTANLQFGGWKDEDVVDPLYQTFKNSYKVTPITRLGYYWGKTLPAPGTPEYAAWPNYIATNVAGRMKDTAHLWQMGNECNLNGEAVNWTNQQITPAEYATLYRSVRAAIKAPAVTGSAGTHQLLIAPPSPGGVVAGVRWMDGNQWLDQTLNSIPSAEIDGVALHAYGGSATARGSFQDFRSSLLSQVATIDGRGLSQTPLYLTEWNRNTQLGNLADEAVTADFARQSLAFLDRWNRTPGNHNIVASTWFVYDGGDGSGTWDSYSIEYFKNHGAYQQNPNAPGSLYKAFYDSARAGYKAGIAGTRPIPASVRIFDNFENTEGHFATASFANVNGTSGLNSAACWKVAQSDADSYTKYYSHKVNIADNTADPGGWKLRFLSGDGTPPNNVPTNLTAGQDGFIGLYVRLFTANGSENLAPAAGQITIQLILDTDGGGGANTDASRPLTVLTDGQWHLYEWSLDKASDWAVCPFVAGSDGQLGTSGSGISGTVTIDSIYLTGGNLSLELLIDTVGHNATGSLNVMHGLPEPAATLPALGAVMLLRRRRS